MRFIDFILTNVKILFALNLWNLTYSKFKISPELEI